MTEAQQPDADRQLALLQPERFEAASIVDGIAAWDESVTVLTTPIQLSSPVPLALPRPQRPSGGAR